MLNRIMREDLIPYLQPQPVKRAPHFLETPLLHRIEDERQKMRFALSAGAQKYREENPEIAAHLKEIDGINFQYRVCGKGSPDGDPAYEDLKRSLVSALNEIPEMR